MLVNSPELHSVQKSVVLSALDLSMAKKHQKSPLLALLLAVFIGGIATNGLYHGSHGIIDDIFYKWYCTTECMEDFVEFEFWEGQCDQWAEVVHMHADTTLTTTMAAHESSGRHFVTTTTTTPKSIDRVCSCCGKKGHRLDGY